MKDKKADTVIHHLMQNWVTAHRCPKKIWSDVSSEFNNDTMRQLGEALGTQVETSASMNSFNERNYYVVDRCFTKIMKEDPVMDPIITLAWAITAKN